MNWHRHGLSASTVYFVQFRVNHCCRHQTLEALHAVLQVWAMPQHCSHVLMWCHLVSRHRPFLCHGVSFSIPFLCRVESREDGHACCKCAHVILPCPIDHFCTALDLHVNLGVICLLPRIVVCCALVHVTATHRVVVAPFHMRVHWHSLWYL